MPNKIKTYELNDIEVFAKGKWKGWTFGDKEIDGIIKSTNEIIDKIKPMVKLGHSEEQKLLKQSGLPAGGWITKLKRVGDKIVADIKEVPKVLYELIKNGAYKRISIELMSDYFEPATKKTYKQVLSAIAFLGGDLPAVTNLKDIAALYDADKNANIIIFEKEIKNAELYKCECIKCGFIMESDKHCNEIKCSECGGDMRRVERPGPGQPHDDTKTKERKVYIMPNGIKITEVEGKKFVAVEDFEKLEQDKKVIETAKKASDEYKAKFEAEQTKAKEKTAELAKVQSEKRTAEIKTYIESNCSEKTMRFMPKQKDILMTLMESVSDDKVIKFTVDEKEVELSQRDMLMKFVDLQPNFADSMFAELSKDKEHNEENDESKNEIKVQKYMDEHKGVNYGDAVKACLEDTE